MQFVLYDITSLGFVRESYDALVFGILEVRLALSLLLSKMHNYASPVSSHSDMGYVLQAFPLYLVSFKEETELWNLEAANLGVIEDSHSRSTAQIGEMNYLEDHK